MTTLEVLARNYLAAADRVKVSPTPEAVQQHRETGFALGDELAKSGEFIKPRFVVVDSRVLIFLRTDGDTSPVKLLLYDVEALFGWIPAPASSARLAG